MNNKTEKTLPPPGTPVAVGMSGGLDSSFAAAWCVDHGLDTIGLTLHMFKEGSRCCSIEDVNRARRVCAFLGIPHYTINAEELFEERIIQPFLEAYTAGRTPSPCILCNQTIKFGLLQERARQYGCTRVATGHYARVARRGDRLSLLKPRDTEKDQTYFLHRLSQEQLAHCLFPLEAMSKDDVRAYAKQRGLPQPPASRGESQDLCFVPDNGHAGFVEQRRPEVRRTGDIVNRNGTVLGRHEGIHRFTRGQRRGLGVAAGEAVYVLNLDPDRNRVVIGSRDEALSRACEVREVHWISGQAPETDFDCRVRIRYRHREADARVRLLRSDRIVVAFREPQFAVTPGQAAVLYHGDEILGGGWIHSIRQQEEAS